MARPDRIGHDGLPDVRDPDRTGLATRELRGDAPGIAPYDNGVCGGGAIADLQTLASWVSPGFPVGAFSYSHGLEWAVAAGDVTEAPELRAWIADVLAHGAGRTDAILLASAARTEDPADLAELALGLAPSAERALETVAQGKAFARTVTEAWGVPVPPFPYPVAFGCAVRRAGLPLSPAVALFVHAFAANLISAGVRLIPLGQTEGQRILAGLTPLIGRIAAEAEAADLDDLGGIALRTDMASMLHETQYTRLYRS